MLVLSLFPGIGLLDSAFEAEGFCVVRGPDVIWGGDIRRFHPPAGTFDGLIGGPPCQSFSSLAHLVRANGHEPKFGNLIPEFERCVREAQPAWFLMENVRAAPEPVVHGYGVKCFLLDNSMLDSGDGWGEEQMRLRKFCFGMRGRAEAPDLRRWIDIATFVLPDADRCATQWQVDNSQEAKGRSRTLTALGTNHLEKLADTTTRTRKLACVAGHDDPNISLTQARRLRRQAVLSDPNAVPDGGERPSERRKAVSGSNNGNGKERNTPGARNNGKGRYRLADACRLQGLPEDFLEHCPMTADGKLKAVANGVPLMMGRAIAKAIKAACTEALTQ